MRASRLIALLLLLAALAGCARPPVEPAATAPAPVEPAPAPVEPAPVKPAPPAPAPAEPEPAQPAAPPNGCVPASLAQKSPPSGYLSPEFNVMQGLCEAVVAAESFHLSFTLPAHVTEEMARAALRVEGPSQPQRVGFSASEARSHLSLTFGPGAVGQVVTVRLAGPVGREAAEADLGFRLMRQPTPTVRTELKVKDGMWHERSSGGTVPREPLLFRFHFTGRPNREWIETRVKGAFEPHKDATTRTHYRMEWESEETLLLVLEEPPPRIWIDFSSVANDQGLRIREGAFLLYTGMPPLLFALDPNTGAEELLLEGAPEDLLYRYASPDGRWIALTALRGDSAYAEELWLLETATGELRLTGLNPSYPDRLFWLPDALVVPTFREVQVWNLSTHGLEKHPSKAEHLTSLSPDGRYLAGFTLDYKRQDPKTYLAPATIVIHDLQSHTEQIFPDVARVAVPRKAAPPSMRMAWPAGGGLLFEERVASGRRWMRLDTATGKTAEATEPPGVEPIGHVPGPVSGPTGWQFRPADPWGPVTLIGPDGREQTFGEGLALGWRPDGKLLVVRWHNWPYRRHPGL